MDGDDGEEIELGGDDHALTTPRPPKRPSFLKGRHIYYYSAHVAAPDSEPPSEHRLYHNNACKRIYSNKLNIFYVPEHSRTFRNIIEHSRLL